ncbi:MAG: polyprenol monophosphomannose synthase [Candidatus Cloacimonadota bacterium]|nr:polyprenol monophosphomannose synthase [Candidatus Cloacimonadota bacterium]
MKENKALVIVPTYNESENMPKLIPEILKQDERIELLIVDDNSPDHTADIVKQEIKKNPRIHLIERAGKMGLGSAYITGFHYGIENKYDYILEMDADFSHDPNALPNLLEAIKTADLVIGSRYCDGINVVNWPFKRLILSVFASKYVRFITGMPVKDPTGGFKCFRRKVLEELDLNRIISEGYSFQVELNYKTWKHNFRISEIPIVFEERRNGQSKMSKKIVYEAIIRVWQLRFFPRFWERIIINRKKTSDETKN